MVVQPIGVNWFLWGRKIKTIHLLIVQIKEVQNESLCFINNRNACIGCENSVGLNYLNTYIEGTVTEREAGITLDFPGISYSEKKQDSMAMIFWQNRMVIYNQGSNIDLLYVKLNCKLRIAITK